MASATDFAKMVPGFDFLQGLMKNAGAGLPHIGQWIAPTLEPERLEEEIQKLRTVQFWLEQNAKLLATTIQALEVQRMTLSTLRTMNLPMTQLRDALMAAPAATAPGAKAASSTVSGTPSAPSAAGAVVPPPAASNKRARAKPPARNGGAAAAAAPGMVDPMQWWGALTQQFTELAAQAMKDSTGEAARKLAGAMVKQSIDTAGATLEKAVAAPVKAARAAAGGAARLAQGAAGRGQRR